MGDTGNSLSSPLLPESEAQSWVNEVAAAADADDTNGSLFGACPVQAPGALQSGSHALLYLNLRTTLQVGVIPTLWLKKMEAQRG